MAAKKFATITRSQQGEAVAVATRVVRWRADASKEMFERDLADLGVTHDYYVVDQAAVDREGVEAVLARCEDLAGRCGWCNIAEAQRRYRAGLAAINAEKIREAAGVR